MKTRILISLLILFSTSYLFAQEDNELQKEYQKIKKQLEASEEKYWRIKYQYIELKQAAKEEMEELDNRYSDLLRFRNSLKEEILSLRSDNRELNGKIDNYNMRISEIFSSQINKIDSLTNFATRNSPFISQKDILLLSDIKTRIEKKENFIRTGGDIIDFISLKIGDSKDSVVEHSDILTKDKILKKGKRLRLGYIFNGYVTDDNEDSGMLLRSGRITKKAFEWHEDISSYRKNISHAVSSLGKKKEIVFLPMDVMQSRAVGKSYAKGESLFGGFIEWFRSGGIVMYGLLIVLLYALFILIERIIFFRRNHQNTDILMTNMLPDIKKNKRQSVIKRCSEEQGSLPRMLIEVLEDDISREEAYNKMQEVLLHEVPVIEKHLPTLKSLGALAPLLGLLGTVSGMISLFDVITTYGTGDPKLLAGGISEALVTTEFGLIVAIPAILLHRILLNIAEHIISDLERYGLSVLNLYWRKK